MKIYWKPVAARSSVDGTPIVLKGICHHGIDLLKEIGKMPRDGKNPISLAAAVQLEAYVFCEMFDTEGGSATADFINKYNGFAGVISYLGYYIVLTGTEYLVEVK